MGRMPWPPFLTLSPLERRVFLVALASLIPVAILSGVLLIKNARDQEQRLYRRSEEMVLALVNGVDSELKSSMSSLDALAASPRLARGDFAALREEAWELMTRRPAWLNIVVSDRRRQLMNARLPEGAPLPEVVSPLTIGEVFASGRPTIGGVMYAPVVRQYAFAVQIPYAPGGEVRYVLTAVIRAESLVEVLKLEEVAGENFISILDRSDLVAARSLNHAKWVGKPPSPELLRLIRAQKNAGRGITHTLEGVPVYTVFRRSEYSNWSVAIGIPQASIDAPLRRSYLMLGAAIVLSILLGLAMALLVGRTIVRPMRELEQQALLAGSGQAPTMPRTRLPEVRRIAVALGAAHDARQTAFQREHEARVAAERASKAKDEFLAMLGHELRNPLSAITNAAQLLERRRDSLDVTAGSAAGIIGRQAKHLARLTDDLLDAGRVILGKISLSRAPVDLAKSVHTTIEELRGTGRLAGHELITDLAPAWTFGDATRIDQIVSNLVTNALKYTPQGGRITVRTRCERDWAMVEVSDTGIGLEPELLPRVFELFVQGERALDRAQGGLGIGLTLVKRLAELHGGSVQAHSAGAGKGANFVVRLPASERPHELQATAGATVPQQRRRIALVEDNEDARISLRMLLEGEGHEVLEACDGQAGIDLLKNHPGIEIAFIDIGLPGKSGYVVAREVREARGAAVRLVAMSGYGADQDVARGEVAGFDAYLVKPADLARVKQELALVSGDGKSAA
jgi:signal transduction histidine kinase/ActR/RegA family two-component response regulator